MKLQPGHRVLLVVFLVSTLTSPSLGFNAAPQQHSSLQADQQQHVAAQQHNSAVAAAQGVLADASLQPPIWPEQFKAVMFQNRTNKLALVQLYYDWKLGANLNLISSQLGSAGPPVWDLEWNNGTSFIFSREQPVCKTLHFDVGILTPDWLKDSKYLGQTAADNFVTNVWTKAKFINYYADKETARPVRWTFLWSGAEFHTMEWDEGATLDNKMWQAPDYCFNQPSPDPAAGAPSILDNPIATGRLMRLTAADEVQQQAEHLTLQGQQQAADKLPTS